MLCQGRFATEKRSWYPWCVGYLVYPFHNQEVDSHRGNFHTTYLRDSKAKEPVEPT